MVNKMECIFCGYKMFKRYLACEPDYADNAEIRVVTCMKCDRDIYIDYEGNMF